MSNGEELLQIHLVPGAYTRAIAAHAALCAIAEKAGQAPPEPPPFRLQGYSGRGARLRTLSIYEKESIASTAAARVGDGASLQEFLSRRGLEGAKAMVAEVTRSAGLRTLDGLKDDDWIELSDADKEGLKDDPSKGKTSRSFSFDKIFTTKDAHVLKELFSKLHDATNLDVEEIEGKAFPVLKE